MAKVRVKAELSHRVAGRDDLLQGGDEFDASEAEVASFGDKFEPVEPEPLPEPEPEKVPKPRGSKKR